jgi:hypothetical protein
MPIYNLPTHVQTIPAPLPPMIAMPETPWYLGEDYDPSEIVFDDKGGVKAGTLRALVARLTPHGSTCMFPSYFIILHSWRMGNLWRWRKESKGDS